MFRSLRVPEKLFSFAMWAVSLVFAGFLIGLGGKVVGELPGVENAPTVDQFIPPEELGRVRSARTTLSAEQSTANANREAAQLKAQAAQNAWTSASEEFSAWIATRKATADSAHDPEVLRRTHGLDELKTVERSTQANVEAIDANLLRISQSLDSVSTAEQVLENDARPAYERAQFRAELSVFIIRLLITLPLLVIAGWMVAKQRKSQYWPLHRGFVLFALFAFFVELVPYLPSYGGYVRYGVGIVATFIAGLYVIRAMQKYLARRQVAELETESERRSKMSYEEAIRKMQANVCPACERAIAGGPQSPSNFCVHCGLNLYDNCAACNTRKNAFFQYCPSCGVPASAKAATNAPGTPATAPLV